MILLTRDLRGNAVWENTLRAHKIPSIHFPCIKITNTLRQTVAEQLNMLNTAFDWVIFTSSNAVRAYYENNCKPEALSIAAIGSKTAHTALVHGMTVSFIPSQPTSTALANEIPLSTKTSVLLLQGSRAPNDIYKILKRRGAAVIRVNAYDTQHILTRDMVVQKHIMDGKIMHLLFASPSAINAFCTRLPLATLNKARAVPTLSIGTTTCAHARKNGFPSSHIDPILDILRS